MNRNRRGLARNHRVNGAVIKPGTLKWTAKRLYVDGVGDVLAMGGQISLCYNFRNVGNAPEEVKIFGPSPPSVARFRQRIDHASLWSVGLNGRF